MRPVRKIYLLGLALLAVFASSALAATSAFAESEILLGGNAIAKLVPITITGELLLEDINFNPKIDVMCQGIFDGMIEPGGKLAFIEELLNISGELLNEAGVLNGAGNDMIDCLALPEADCSGGVALVTVNLDGTTLWKVDVILEGSAYLAHFLETAEAGETNVVTPMYTVDCVAPLIGLVEDLCEGLSTARLYMQGTTLRGSFNSLAITEPFGANSQLTFCSQGGANSGLLESEKGGVPDTEESGGVIASPEGALTLS
jgi:hypothetical protein